jgi:hypothetical protein
MKTFDFDTSDVKDLTFLCRNTATLRFDVEKPSNFTINSKRSTERQRADRNFVNVQQPSRVSIETTVNHNTETKTVLSGKPNVNFSCAAVQYANQFNMLLTFVFFIVFCQLSIGANMSIKKTDTVQHQRMHTHFDTPVITAVLILLYTQIAASLVNEEAKFLHTSLVLQNMLAICSMTIFAKHEYDSTWVLFLVFIVFNLQMVFLFLQKHNMQCSQFLLAHISALILCTVLDLVTAIVLSVNNNDLHGSTSWYCVLLILLSINIFTMLYSIKMYCIASS